MSLARTAKRRDANEAEIRAALHQIGVTTYPLDKPVDLLCWHRDKFFLIEVKDGSKPPSERKLTKGQEEFFMMTPGLPRFKVESIQQALEAVQSLHNEPRDEI